MLIKTKGIIFRTIKYSESSVIADIFTEEKGLMSYLIGGVRKPKSRTQPSLLMPLSIVDMVAYHSERNKLHRIKEIKPGHVFRSIPFDMRKASISLFLSELCSKTVRGTEAQPELYHFFEQQILELDHSEEGFNDAHLFFMVGFARQLGFGIEPPDKDFAVFDLMHGTFTDQEPPHPYWTKHAKLHSSLAVGLPGQSFTRQERNALLDDLITYFRLHVDGMPELKAHHVLRQVL